MKKKTLITKSKSEYLTYEEVLKQQKRNNPDSFPKTNFSPKPET